MSKDWGLISNQDIKSSFLRHTPKREKTHSSYGKKNPDRFSTTKKKPPINPTSFPGVFFSLNQKQTYSRKHALAMKELALGAFFFLGGCGKRQQKNSIQPVDSWVHSLWRVFFFPQWFFSHEPLTYWLFNDGILIMVYEGIPHITGYFIP